MGNTNLVGSTLLSNLKNKRIDSNYTEVLAYDYENEDLKEVEEIDTEIYEKEIDIRDYMDKPLEFLIRDANISSDYFLEEDTKQISSSDFIDIEYVEKYDKDVPFFDDEVKETVYYDMETAEAFSRTEGEKIDEETLMSIIDSLEQKIKNTQDALKEKSDQINHLREENLGLQKTLMREQDIVMKEQDLHNKTLTKVEKLLLDKRGELIERQKASKKNWFLKLIDKIKS